MNKKLSFLFAALMVLFVFNACESDLYQDRYEDTTKLWPAADPTGEKVGYINEKGEMVIPAQYKQAYFFSCGVAKVVTFDKQIQFINKQGKVVHTCPKTEVCDDYFCNGYIRFYQSINLAPGSFDRPNLCGLLNRNFNVVLTAEFFELGNMSKEGLVASWQGYYNKKGKLVLTFRSDEPFDIYNSVSYRYGDFCDGVAVVSIYRFNNGHEVAGAINTKGEWVVDTIYNDLQSVGNGLLAYKDSTYNYGLMSVDGQKITEPIFYNVTVFGENGLMPVRAENGYGYVDTKGSMKIAPKYRYCELFHEGVAWVEYEYGRYRLIDTDDNVVLELERDFIPLTDSHNGLLCVLDYNNNIAKYIDRNNNVVYSWDVTPNEGLVFYPRLQPARFQAKREDMMLRMYEGTEIYPLMEQLYKHESNLQK